LLAAGQIAHASVGVYIRRIRSHISGIGTHVQSCVIARVRHVS
jgi:hypothetical protein